MSQFKAGDTVLIVGSSWPDCPNIGKSVELIGFYAPGAEFMCPDGQSGVNGGDESLWLCVAPGLMAMNAVFDFWMDRGGSALSAARYLMPLKGDFAPEQQKAKEAEPCL